VSSNLLSSYHWRQRMWMVWYFCTWANSIQSQLKCIPGVCLLSCTITMIREVNLKRYDITDFISIYIHDNCISSLYTKLTLHVYTKQQFLHTLVKLRSSIFTSSLPLQEKRRCITLSIKQKRCRT